MEKNSKYNSTVTAIVGRARSGKTHFLYNLEHRLNEEGQYKAIGTLLQLAGEDISIDYIVEKIINNPPFQRTLEELEINQKDRDYLEIINDTIEKLQTTYGVDVGLILMVDNFDEHLRQRKTKLGEEDVKEDIEQFLGIFRLLIEKIPKGMVVIFSLTEDAYSRINKEFLTDPTLRGRFEFIYDPSNLGNILQLSELGEEEAIDLVSKYMSFWSGKNGLELPYINECVCGERNIFPFTRDAIELLRDAGGFAGYICFGCRDAISEKFESVNISNNTFNDLVIGNFDVAKVIASRAGMWPYIEEVRDRIENSIDWKTIYLDVNKWMNTTGKEKYKELTSPAFTEKFKSAFKEYIQHCYEEEGIIEFDVLVKDVYKHKDFSLDVILKMENGSVGFTTTSEGLIDARIGEPMRVALMNGDISHGIFLYHGEKSRSYKGDKLPHITADLYENLKDYQEDRDFNAVVEPVKMENIFPWAMVYSYELTNQNRKSKVFAWINRNIQLAESMNRLLQKSPKDISAPPFKPDLDRGGV